MRRDCLVPAISADDGSSNAVRLYDIFRTLVRRIRYQSAMDALHSFLQVKALFFRRLRNHLGFAYHLRLLHSCAMIETICSNASLCQCSVRVDMQE
jgi:hypothetical protein